jgi:UDP-3-O-[3-hydroxymyristoyl] glucosamine N-acyltransferase
MRLIEIAERLGCRLTGDGSAEIHSLAGLEQAQPGQLTFLANPKYAVKVKETRASAVLTRDPIDGIACLISGNPYLDFARALSFYYQPPRPRPGVHPTAFIEPTASVGPNASIGAFCYVGERVLIGADCVLHPHVTVYEGAEIGDSFLAHSHVSVREFCRIGNRVTLQNSVVIGGDGFGFAKDADGRHQKIVQSGIVVIEDDVEIQSLTSVDRATMGETRIRRGARIDSLVQIGHACEVGEDNIICGQVGLAGSSVLKKNVLLAGQVGIAGHLTIHEDSVIYAQSGIGQDVPARSVLSGSPAFAAKDWLRSITAFQKLGDLVRSVRQMDARLKKLEHAANQDGAQQDGAKQ